MNLWRTWARPGFWHALGALGLQATTAWLCAAAFGGSIFDPLYAWYGATAGGGFFTAREVWTCWRVGHYQRRFSFDVLTAVVPVLAVALWMEFVR